jgi:hypothetical protein
MQKVKDQVYPIARGGGRALLNFFYSDRALVNQTMELFLYVYLECIRANARTMSVANWPRSAFYWSQCPYASSRYNKRRYLGPS